VKQEEEEEGAEGESFSHWLFFLLALLHSNYSTKNSTKKYCTKREQ
jgi:hypothetical protein